MKMFYRILFITAIVLTLSALCLASSDTLEFSDNGITFNGKIQTLPCSQDEITFLFGSPSEVDPARSESSSTVLEWSQVGVYAYVRPKTGVVYAIGVSISPKFPERKFEKSFSGSIFVNGTHLDLTKAGFKLAGFERSNKYANWKQELEGYYITVITESPDDPREIEFGVRSD